MISFNRFLLPIGRTKHDFFKTEGRWEKIDKETYSLNSSMDTLIYPLTEIKKSPAKVDSLSNFTFYDTDGDPIGIDYVKLSDSSLTITFHHYLLDFSENLVKRDTFEFHFFGYKPFTFISGEKKNYDYKVTLKPAFRPGYLNEVKFRVKGKKLYLGNTREKAVYKRMRI